MNLENYLASNQRQAGDQLQRQHQRLQGLHMLAGVDSAEGHGN